MLKYAANVSILWRDIPLQDRLDAVRRAGLGAFEFLFVCTFGLADLVSAKDQFGLEVALFDLDIGDPTFKTSYGYLCRPDGEQQFLRSVDDALDMAGRLGCRRLNALVGMETPGASWEEQRDLMVRRLALVAPDAQQAGVQLLVEPISTQLLPGYLVNYAHQAIEIVDLVNSPAVGYQCDLYHMQLTEGNLISNLQRYITRIGHVQVADVPGRHEPGTGEINFANVLRALDETGYQGYVGLEYAPVGPDPFSWIRELPAAATT